MIRIDASDLAEIIALSEERKKLIVDYQKSMIDKDKEVRAAQGAVRETISLESELARVRSELQQVEHELRMTQSFAKSDLQHQEQRYAELLAASYQKDDQLLLAKKGQVNLEDIKELIRASRDGQRIAAIKAAMLLIEGLAPIEVE